MSVRSASENQSSGRFLGARSLARAPNKKATTSLTPPAPRPPARSPFLGRPNRAAHRPQAGFSFFGADERASERARERNRTVSLSSLPGFDLACMLRSTDRPATPPRCRREVPLVQFACSQSPVSRQRRELSFLLHRPTERPTDLAGRKKRARDSLSFQFLASARMNELFRPERGRLIVAAAARRNFCSFERNPR